MTEYSHYKEDAWRDFGSQKSDGLCYKKEKGSEPPNRKIEQQTEFLHVCKSGKDSFLNYIDNRFSGDSVIKAEEIILNHKFCELEFRKPPLDTEEIIWNTFKPVSSTAEVCDSGFWGYVIVTMIRDEKIKPSYLASNSNGVNTTGAYIIDKALGSDTKAIDDCVRLILRSMCAPPHGRGPKRVIRENFPLGKAYWRWHWSYKMSQHINLDFNEILKILDENYYGGFSEKMCSGKSYISSINTLGGLLLYLKLVDKKKITSNDLKKIIDRLSYLSAWKAIEMQEPELTQIEIQEISKNL